VEHRKAEENWSRANVLRKPRQTKYDVKRQVINLEKESNIESEREKKSR
jgi:hypothetical protein